MSKKYKVLVAHNYYQIPGGEDTVVKNEAEMLKENGHEVILYTRHNDEIKNMGKLGKLKLLFKTIFSIKTYNEVKEIIKKENIDILHIHNTLPLISPSIYYAALSMKVPVVQTIHNFRLLCPSATFTRDNKICEECVEKGLRRALKYKCYRGSLLQTFTVYMMGKIHRVMNTYNRINYKALTEFNKNKLGSLVTKRDNIFIKPNFMKNDNYSDEKRDIKDYFVFIGRVDKLKGINVLIEAWKEIKGSKLLIIGDGPERENVEKYIDENNIENIELLGFMDRDKAFEYIKKSKAIIVPSLWYEGFPMTIVEAFALGVPVIASKLGNMESIIGDEYNGLLFKYEDANDLRRAINIVIESPSLNQNLSRNAKETYLSKYTHEINYNQLMNVYSKVVGD